MHDLSSRTHHSSIDHSRIYIFLYCFCLIRVTIVCSCNACVSTFTNLVWYRIASSNPAFCTNVSLVCVLPSSQLFQIYWGVSLLLIMHVFLLTVCCDVMCTGAELVNWCVKSALVQTRSDALVLADLLLRAGLIDLVRI